ncbi:MAG: nucleotidyltransferase substrate binding protein [Roseovarius sp.]
MIEDVERWIAYHEARNLTFHTYDRNVADEIFRAAGDFLPEAKALLIALEERNDYAHRWGRRRTI